MKSLLRFITCGSVDDGKSTLIGHMLYDAKLLFTDQEEALKLDSRLGSRGGEIDYSLLLDGLMAEREQGITIDVAYRYFTTRKRSFIVADTPGHEEYTRNMAVGASYADLAVILVDASRGILTQTRRHARICALMGIRYFVFALNKMDLIDYDREKAQQMTKDILKLGIDLELPDVCVIPVSATRGDNITEKSANMPWYRGSTLLAHLETVNISEHEEEGFVMPVQRVCRPDHTFRGFAGQIECGEVSVGDEITVLPSGEKAHVTELFIGDRKSESAGSGRAVTLKLDREIDVSRGCVFSGGTTLQVSNMFTAKILWMDDERLVEGKTFLIRIGTQKLPATVMQIKYRIDVNTGSHVPAKTVYKNELAYCDLALSRDGVYDRFEAHSALGSFILIDRVSHMTSACGVIEHPLRRADNVTWQKLDITRQLRAQRLGQKPCTLWFTGLSGAGKSTLANEVEKALFIRGMHTMLLDGDNIRMGINRNLGFEEKDRIENIRRVAEVAKLLNDAGIVVLTSFISPYEADRQSARDIIGADAFVEIYVSTSLEECERRDVKGLYAKARSGQIPNFTGIGSRYEAPEHPDITVNTEGMRVEESAGFILRALEQFLIKSDDQAVS